MGDPIETYTYRNGRRIELRKLPDEFTVLAPAQVMRERGFEDVQAEGARMSRVRVRADRLEPEMSRARFVAPTHHVYEMPDSGQRYTPTDQLFVTFRDGVSLGQINELLSRHSLVPVARLSSETLLVRLTNHTGMNPIKLVRALTEEEDLVEIAEHNLVHHVRKAGFQPPTDPGYPDSQWHLHTHMQHPELDVRASTNCEQAWMLLSSFGSPDVVIGITDDGCRMDHVDFQGPGKFAGWAYFDNKSNFITSDDLGADPQNMYVAYNNHGTACAGVAAAQVNAQLTVGAAPDCRLLPIRFPSEGSGFNFDDWDFYLVLDYIKDKVDILSNSWASTPNTLWPLLVQAKIRELAQSGGRRGKGILFLWAAGNENCPIHWDAPPTAIPFTDGWEQRWEFNEDGAWLPPRDEWIGVMSAYRFENELVGIPGVMHVAALASTAQRSHYSNYGPGISICAPSNNWHTYGRGVVEGLPILTTSGETNHAIEKRFGGTSSATPLVAGIAALVISANPNLSARDVASILKQTASKDLNFEGYPRTSPTPYDPDPTRWDVSPVAPFDKGDFLEIDPEDASFYGIDPEGGTWSPWFGHGRVDAAAAVQAALDALADSVDEPLAEGDIAEG